MSALLWLVRVLLGLMFLSGAALVCWIWLCDKYRVDDIDLDDQPACCEWHQWEREMS